MTIESQDLLLLVLLGGWYRSSQKQRSHREGDVPVAIGRRELIAALGSAAAWPLAARAQQPERVRRIGVLMNVAAADPQGQAQLVAFQQGLQQLGWSEGRNVRIDTRWGENDIELDRRYAAELLAFMPDVILATSTLAVAALTRVTRTSAIVFAGVSDPVGAGFVDTLARPGGNVTGFMIFEYSLSGKWLELLKEIAPRIIRAAVLRGADNPAGIAQFGAIQAVAQSLGVELRPVDIRDAGEVEHAIAGFARTANGGLIVTPSASVSAHHDLIVTLAARHKLPAVYSSRPMVIGGGLIGYGPDIADQFRQAAGYVDRILRGEKPGDLPVQAPTKYELVINLKTAKALGLDLPASVLARADEVLE
jgi:putative tryptophan/tyrosine transport system substrate-binding protein